MRRRILLLAAGFQAYFIGATVNAYLRRPEPCGGGEAGCRILAVVEHPRAAMLDPLKVIECLVAPVCNG